MFEKDDLLRYLRKVFDAFNSQLKRLLLNQRMKTASAKCCGESLKVCQEFEQADFVID